MSSPQPHERTVAALARQGAQPDSLALHRMLSTISLTLCHVQELIGLAYQLSCEVHPQDPPEAILRTTGRLATLMHVSQQQLQATQTETRALLQAIAPAPQPG